MCFYEKIKKSKRPSLKSFFESPKAVKDKLIAAKFQFFSFIADHFKPFLTGYQTDVLMILVLYSDLKKQLHELLSLIVKADVIDKIKNICNVNLNNCMFLSCCICISEWIHTLYLPEYQGTPFSKQAWNLKFKWLQLDSNPQPHSL